MQIFYATNSLIELNIFNLLIFKKKCVIINRLVYFYAEIIYFKGD